VGNYGLGDQKNAMLWINKVSIPHSELISSSQDLEVIPIVFSLQDSLLVLVCPISDIANHPASMDVHLRSSYNHLFSSTILLSGTAPICGIYSPEQYEVLYFKLLKEVNVPFNSDRLARLRAVPHSEISRATYAIFQGLDVPQFGISTDMTALGGSLIRPAEYTSNKIDYKGKIIIGDCQREFIQGMLS
jgi:hypothetical protein